MAKKNNLSFKFQKCSFLCINTVNFFKKLISSTRKISISLSPFNFFISTFILNNSLIKRFYFEIILDSHAHNSKKKIEGFLLSFAQFPPVVTSCITIKRYQNRKLTLIQSTHLAFLSSVLQVLVLCSNQFCTKLYFKCPHAANYLRDSILIPSIKKLSLTDKFSKINLTFHVWYLFEAQQIKDT